MKVALCISGQPRYLEEGYAHINKNILQKYSPDVFVHTWWDNSMSNKRMELPATLSYGRTYYWKEDTIDVIKKIYKPAIFLYEPQIVFDTFNDVNYELARPSNVHSMFFSIQRSNQLKMQYEKENSFLYDIVIRCRFDIEIIKFDIDLYNLSMDYVNCYAMKESPNSDLAISSSKNMDIYSSLYDNFKKYKQDGWKQFVGEGLVKHHLNKNNISWDNPVIRNKLINSIIIK
ncbi:MAG: hypothetical protein CL831_00040 [Crocinitomicaceae bacterium]|nr:hypothetical protein [Crocinitomicaceae bacterium]|tara:strand:- start:16 stop:708 length:693 start_codon:yes stop_codon:yes gene_type:complete